MFNIFFTLRVFLIKILFPNSFSFAMQEFNSNKTPRHFIPYPISVVQLLLFQKVKGRASQSHRT